MSNVVIARPIDGVTINNELEFLLDSSGAVRVFWGWLGGTAAYGFHGELRHLL